MKKLLTVFLAVGLIASMTACAGDSNDNSTEASTEVSTEATTEGNTEANKETNDNQNFFESADDDVIVVEDFTGKTLATVYESGYTYVGNSSTGDSVTVYFENNVADENIEKLINNIKDMTVGELVDEYDISIGYSKEDGEYTFYIYLESISFSCNLENGAAAREAHKDDILFDLEDAEEVQNDKLENLALESIRYTAELDEASCKKLLENEDVDKELIKEMQAELVLSKFYYTVE